MKFKKLISTLILTTVMMFAFTLVSYATTYSVTPSNGSTIKPGDAIEIVATAEGNKGILEFKVVLYDGATGAEINKGINNITDKVIGNNPVASRVLVPANCTSTSIKAVATGKESDGSSIYKEYNFNGPRTSGGSSIVSNGNTLTITASKPSGSTIAKKEVVSFITTSSNKAVGTKTCLVEIFDDNTGELVEAKPAAQSSYETGSNPLTYNKTMPDENGRYRARITSTDINGVKAVNEFVYIVEGDEEYEGYINEDLDGLAIDLWLREDTRFYELEEDEIPFVAFYYNADKKEAKKVTIEVEIPDGFEVVSKSTEYGSVKYRNDTITYDIGTVPSKELRKVYFTLRAEDDDVCEMATNICAVILRDDDEEDQSTQRIWVYEEDGKGTFNAYVTGYPDGTFRADNNITREEVAAIMARAFNHSVVNTTKSFSDVKNTSWAYNYIMACTTKGIITGYTNGTFKPLNNITRAELYAMTYRAMDIPTDEKAIFVPKAYRKDDSWEKNYIAGLVRLKMMTDMKDRDADELATRAEVVYLVNQVQFRNPSKMLDVEYSDLKSKHWCAKHIAAASCNYSFKRGEDGEEIMSKK